MYKHANKERLCYHCNELHDSIEMFTIKDRDEDEHDTIFSGDTLTINLCPSCMSKLGVKRKWFDNNKSYNSKMDAYDNEDDIIKIIDGFPICNQEYCINIDNDLNGIVAIDRMDWINSASGNFSFI
ncbi:MAG: hypothetical protein RSC24_06545 [Clostridium sp.]